MGGDRSVRYNMLCKRLRRLANGIDGLTALIEMRLGAKEVGDFGCQKSSCHTCHVSLRHLRTRAQRGVFTAVPRHILQFKSHPKRVWDSYVAE